ncbi:hypothetical protein [Streptomyces kronopolitis]|uniref:hypothetical protein n=1 Tax=Streptomyces kronopolitis TaxID=1612435 RepID=UPI0016680448|nr:hypothetical protein [Streptomyces kronopolitis]
MAREIPASTGRRTERDLYTANRDRHLRVTGIEPGDRAVCLFEHDPGATAATPPDYARAATTPSTPLRRPDGPMMTTTPAPDVPVEYGIASTQAPDIENLGRISRERAEWTVADSAECHQGVYLVARRPGSPWERA